MKSREPIFGPNAKPFFIQFAVAIVVGFTAHYFLAEPLYNAAHAFFTGLGIPD